MFNVIKFLEDYNIPYTLKGKNVSPGWVGLRCVLCNDNSSHGGFNLEKGYYSCWRCGKHNLIKIIQKLGRISALQAKNLIRAYQTPYLIPNEPPAPLQRATGPLKLPSYSPLQSQHRAYLLKRNFNPQLLEKKYSLYGTGPIGKFKHRIIIPIIQEGEIVSYLGRDITGKSELRYKPCPKEEEITPHKHCIYNIDSCLDKAIIVEGVTDVWRIGDGAIATFGIQFTKEQVLTIVRKKFKKVFILYDNEPQAQKQAEKLGNNLENFMEVETLNITSKDPGEATEEEITELLKYIQMDKVWN